MNKIYKIGYARKLSKEDDLEEQKRRLIEAGCDADKICVDYNVETRNGFKMLEKLVREGDEVVVCSLERLNRRPYFLEETIYNKFEKKGISVVSLDDPWFTTKGEEGKRLKHFISDFCKYIQRAERARQKYRMERQKAKRGRGPLPKVDEEEAMKAAERIERGVLMKDEFAKQYNISIPTVNRMCRRYREKYQIPEHENKIP